MTLLLADLLCQSCHGYVHPFLDRCPGCGASRPSRLRELRAGAELGAAAMVRDPAVVQAAAEAVRRATLTGARQGLSARRAERPELEDAAGVDPAEMVNYASAGLSYRVRGVLDVPAEATEAVLRVTGDRLVLAAARGGTTLVAVEPWLILAASPSAGRDRSRPPWDGTWLDGLRAPLATLAPGGDLVVFRASGRGIASFSIANPSGFFATRARPEHYEGLARWIALLAITGSEPRWREVGIDGYLAELGLVPAVDTERHEETHEAGAPRGTGTQGSVREALLELDELRGAGLVTSAEYEAKRRAILDRL
ncbi:MAG: hypothetical protein ACP5VP_01055 [Candidatus Limnocylindrales bacterium]